MGAFRDDDDDDEAMVLLLLLVQVVMMEVEMAVSVELVFFGRTCPSFFFFSPFFVMTQSFQKLGCDACTNGL